MDFVELGLQKPDFRTSGEGVEGYSRLTDGLLECVAVTALEAEPLNVNEFRDAIGVARRRLRAATDRVTFDAEVRHCLALCGRQFDRVRRHVTDREAGFAEIIEVLTAAVDDIAGQSSAFNARLLGESDSMGRLVATLDDMSELKRQITERVGALRGVIAGKQQRDESQRARLSNRVKSLQLRVTEAETAALVDQLTGVGNRRYFERSLTRFIATAIDSGRPFTLSLLDIDDFKRVNDVHGHQVGDRVLTALAQRVAHRLRKTDVVARYGGEEFVVLLADSVLANATHRLAALVEEIGQTDATYEDSARLRFTVSGGVAEYSFHETDEELIKRADEALYAAKRAGKNRVVASVCPTAPNEAAS